MTSKRDIKILTELLDLGDIKVIQHFARLIGTVATVGKIIS